MDNDDFFCSFSWSVRGQPASAFHMTLSKTVCKGWLCFVFYLSFGDAANTKEYNIMLFANTIEFKHYGQETTHSGFILVWYKLFF